MACGTICEDSLLPVEGRFNKPERLGQEPLIFFLACRASTHKSTGTTPASMMFGTELRLTCDQLFGASADKEQSTTDCVVDLVDRLHDIHHYAYQHFF
jgi:hypothetical protein